MEPDDKRKTTRIWILRHGRSTLNDAQTFQGCGMPSELTSEGVMSAREAGERLQGEYIDVIYSSPLQRAVQTAELVRVALSKAQPPPELVMDEALLEMDIPLWEGLTYTTVRERYAEQYRCFQRSPETFFQIDPDRGEFRPVREMEERVRKFLNAAIGRRAGGRILLVTHGGPASVVLLSALQLPVRHLHSLRIMHGRLSCLTVEHWPDHLWIDTMNEVNHSNCQLPKLKNGKGGLRLLLVASDRQDDRAVQEDQISKMIRGISVHGVFAAEQDGHALAERILGLGRQSRIRRGTLPELCEAIDSHMNSRHSDGLLNLLIAAPGDLIALLVNRCMGWDRDLVQLNQSPCRGLTVIHAPDATGQPVLQAMNICSPCLKVKSEIA